jgi:hypothetical protein
MRKLLLIIILCLQGGAAIAATITVRKDGSGNYSVIQDAVDHAAPGDTIRIGPGRYEEKKPYSSYPPANAEKWIFDVYVAVTVSDLTIIGSGSEQTIIGPSSRLWVDPAEPKAICALTGVRRLVVEDLAMENVFNGVYRSQGGTLDMRRCKSYRCMFGVTTWSEQNTLLESCIFQDIDYGVVSYSPASNVAVLQCSFLACSASFDRTTNAVVSDSQFNGYTVGCQYANGSTGGISSCLFTNQANVAVAVITGSVVDLQSNQLLGGAVNLRLRTLATVTGSGNTFGGGSSATIRLSASDIELHGNQILHGAGWSVYLEAFSAPLKTLDLSDNYWGTDSADTIASWIYDAHDNPTVYGDVLFEPFTGQPVPTEATSWGDLKAAFR